jgi:2-methylcitrate dehydratase PrpD
MHHSHRHANNGLAVPSLTQLAAQHLERIRNSKLTSEVRDKTVLCLLDYLGALISGLSTPWASALLKYAGASSGGACGLPTSSQGAVNVMGLGSHCSAEQAAFTNASIAHR